MIFGLLCTLVLYKTGEAKPVSKVTTLSFDKKQIPKSISFKGKVVRGLRWLDVKGENYVVFSETSNENSWYVYANHYRMENKSWKLIRKVRDKQKCKKSNNLGTLQRSSIKLTDLDKDVLGEVTFVYMLGCGKATDISAKLMFLEDGKKFAIRGTPQIDNQKTGVKQKSQNKVDASFAKASPKFLKFSGKVWKKYTPIVIQADGSHQTRFILEKRKNKQGGKKLTDAHFIKQIHAALKIQVDEFSPGVSISEKQAMPFGFLIKSSRFEAACQANQVSTFTTDGTLIKAVEISLGCDCPSECEGCFDFASMKWTNKTSFFVKREVTHVVKQLPNDQCKTKVVSTKTTYTIQKDGKIKKSNK